MKINNQKTINNNVPSKRDIALKSKKKPTNKLKKYWVLFFCLTAILIIFTTLALTFFPSIAKQSERNTYEVTGIVTDFEYITPVRFGQNLIRKSHFIHLDNGMKCEFPALLYERYYDDPNLEKIKNELEGQYVVLRLSNFDDRVITINTKDKCYLSFEASNSQHTVGTIGIIICDLCILFIFYFCFLNPMIPIKKQTTKNNRH